MNLVCDHIFDAIFSEETMWIIYSALSPILFEYWILINKGKLIESVTEIEFCQAPQAKVQGCSTKVIEVSEVAALQFNFFEYITFLKKWLWKWLTSKCAMFLKTSILSYTTSICYTKLFADGKKPLPVNEKCPNRQWRNHEQVHPRLIWFDLD